MATEAGCYAVNKKDPFYELGQVMVEVSNIQQSLRNAKRMLDSAKASGNLDVVVRCSFDCGRLAQALHYIRDKYNLDIRIQDILPSNDKATRDGFAVARITNG